MSRLESRVGQVRIEDMGSEVMREHDLQGGVSDPVTVDRVVEMVSGEDLATVAAAGWRAAERPHMRVGQDLRRARLQRPLQRATIRYDHCPHQKSPPDDALSFPWGRWDRFQAVHDRLIKKYSWHTRSVRPANGYVRKHPAAWPVLWLTRWTSVQKPASRP